VKRRLAASDSRARKQRCRKAGEDSENWWTPGSISPAGSACYFFITIVVRHETTAAARWALLLIVRTLFDDAIAVAVWTGFHVCLPVDTFASLPAKNVSSLKFEARISI
jgi:hypothetical protein